MDYGPFGVRFLFFNTKKERRSIDELLIYFATPPFCCYNIKKSGSAGQSENQDTRC